MHNDVILIKYDKQNINTYLQCVWIKCLSTVA